MYSSIRNLPKIQATQVYNENPPHKLFNQSSFLPEVILKDKNPNNSGYLAVRKVICIESFFFKHCLCLRVILVGKYSDTYVL